MAEFTVTDGEHVVHRRHGFCTCSDSSCGVLEECQRRNLLNPITWEDIQGLDRSIRSDSREIMEHKEEVVDQVRQVRPVVSDGRTIVSLPERTRTRNLVQGTFKKKGKAKKRKRRQNISINNRRSQSTHDQRDRIDAFERHLKKQRK